MAMEEDIFILNELPLTKVGKNYKEMEKLVVELDTCVDVSWEMDEGYSINPYGTQEEGYFLELLAKNGIQYEVVDPKGPAGWPAIKYTGTKEQLITIFAVMNAMGYDEDEISEMLADWDGDTDSELFENVMF